MCDYGEMLSSSSRISAKAINKRWDSAGLKYDFLLNSATLPPLTDNQSALKKQRLRESCLLLNAHWFFTHTLQYQDSKSGKYSILIELGPPVLESSTRISYFYAPTDSEYKFHKTRIENYAYQ